MDGSWVKEEHQKLTGKMSKYRNKQTYKKLGHRTLLMHPFVWLLLECFYMLLANKEISSYLRSICILNTL